MKAMRDPELLIKAYLDEGLDELPERSFDAVRSAIDQTRQWAVIGPWKEPQIMTATRFVVIAAAVAVLAVVAIRFLPTSYIGPGPTPSPTPTIAPTRSVTPISTEAPPASVVDPSGQLEPGTYVLHPFPAPNNKLAAQLTMPSDKWEGMGDPNQTFGIVKFGDSGGVGMGLLRINGLEPDPCRWNATADVPAGSSVNDLVTALSAQTNYETSAATDVSLGGYSGKHIVLTMPDTLSTVANLQTGCDEGIWQPFSADGFGIYAQGPSNLWTLDILDVEGERVVIMKSDFATTDATLRQELQSIVDSVVITP